ncbi:MAG: hypothetical protein CMQ75_01955 [Gammaproteobacteria bacterium]|nr:hypothetical protein [Gammaproteobacteria bacterium]RPG99558.1 MAG: hypothetical protein CBC78_002155 [Candidatus Pelagibacter sp. TMED118]|tara:strand:- start:3070 stop:3603 length:534 start_codon:yes stop_codon:yes gene_type:complete
MTNLKELTWEEHKNAERQAFVKELMGGISVERYCDFLHNQHPQYNLLENFARLHSLTDVIIAPKIHADILELEKQLTDYKPKIYPVVKEYTDHLMKIKEDPHKLMAHIYVRHMGDLSGGQMISKRTPGEGTMYQFDEDVNILKDKIRTRLDDSMSDEAKVCFNFATELFKQMSVSNN